MHASNVYHCLALINTKPCSKLIETFAWKNYHTYTYAVIFEGYKFYRFHAEFIVHEILILESFLSP